MGNLWESHIFSPVCEIASEVVGVLYFPKGMFA